MPGARQYKDGRERTSTTMIIMMTAAARQGQRTWLRTNNARSSVLMQANPSPTPLQMGPATDDVMIPVARASVRKGNIISTFFGLWLSLLHSSDRKAFDSDDKHS